MLVRCGNKPSKLLIQMELCDGTLTNYLKEIRLRQDHIKEREIQSVLVQILAGLCYCHSEGIVHRDLKPNNGTVHTQSIRKISNIL